MSKISWWSKFCALPRFSFLLAEGPSVRKVHDTCGNWVDQSAVSQIVDDMQAEINALRERLERLKPEGARSSVPQDVEEFIEHHAETDPDGGEWSDVIYADDLRAWMTGHARVPVELLEQILADVRDKLQEANNEAYPVCCGRSGSECCGSPEPEWPAHAMKIMDTLGPVERNLSALLNASKGEESE